MPASHQRSFGRACPLGKGRAGIGTLPTALAVPGASASPAPSRSSPWRHCRPIPETLRIVGAAWTTSAGTARASSCDVAWASSALDSSTVATRRRRKRTSRPRRSQGAKLGGPCFRRSGQTVPVWARTAVPPGVANLWGCSATKRTSITLAAGRLANGASILRTQCRSPGAALGWALAGGSGSSASPSRARAASNSNWSGPSSARGSPSLRVTSMKSSAIPRSGSAGTPSEWWRRPSYRGRA
mmetsp:Transcript_22783/g.49938  ORF Transcript_22783/g.49938 Transcript_22783/m.49938 type:complete len:242 (+) Transcript_22783:106-831(+)